MTHRTLHHHHDPVRQRPSAPGLRAGTRAGRRARPLPPERGEQVRFQTGTDDNSLKNVLAAEAAGSASRSSWTRNAAAFTGLAGPLSLSVDDLIRTSRDPRHRPGSNACGGPAPTRATCTASTTRASTASAASSSTPRPNLTRRALPRARHPAPAGLGGKLVLPPVPLRRPAARPHRRRHDAYRASRTPQRGPGSSSHGGLEDFSISRSHRPGPRLGHPGARRPRPGDLRVVGRARQLPHRPGLRRRRRGPQPLVDRSVDSRIHLLGKGVLRFHAVYWPAILLSAGRGRCRPTSWCTATSPTTAARSANPAAPRSTRYDLVGQYGTDAVRWWLLREVPRGADADYTIDRLVSRANEELANGLGNLVNRVVAMIHRYGRDTLPAPKGQPPDRGSWRGSSRRRTVWHPASSTQRWPTSTTAGPPLRSGSRR